MDRPPVDIASERLVRKAPNQILALDSGDQDYIRDALASIESAYEIAAIPDAPIGLIPGRALMRLLVDLRAQLRPRTDDQREAWGKLAGAILILDTASSFAVEHSKAMERRLHDDPPESD